MMLKTNIVNTRMKYDVYRKGGAFNKNSGVNRFILKK
jgi:hypothetical protein